MKKLIHSIVTILVLVLVLYLTFLTRKYKGYYDYHRSRMFEYQTLALITLNIPNGSRLDFAMEKLSLTDSLFRGEQGNGVLEINPELPIKKNEYKDYSGFYMHYKDSILTWIEPVGPDYARNEISLEYLKSNLKYPLWNQP